MNILCVIEVIVLVRPLIPNYIFIYSTDISLDSVDILFLEVLRSGKQRISEAASAQQGTTWAPQILHF
jgi:hypothetical protein